MKNFENIKVIIFDFDETMYYSSNIKEYYTEYIKSTLKALTSYDDETIISTMQQYGFFAGGNERISFGKNCEKFGVTKEQWNSYRIDNFFQIDYEHAETANNDTYVKLSKTKKLYIVSNEVLENVKYKAEKMNINLDPFIIYAPTKQNVLNYQSNKQEIYRKIIEQNNCLPSEVIVLGDRYNVDIKPLEELGGSGILIKHAKEIDEIFKENLI